MNRTCTALNKILMHPCAGASNVGQLTMRAVQELVLDGLGELAGDAPNPDLQEIRKRTTNGQPFIVVDGCEQQCGRKRFESFNCAFEFHLSLADLGIEKTESASVVCDELQLVKDAIIAESTRLSELPPKIMGGCGCR